MVTGAWLLAFAAYLMAEFFFFPDEGLFVKYRNMELMSYVTPSLTAIGGILLSVGYALKTGDNDG